MPRATDLPNSVRQSLARQISERLPQAPGLAAREQSFLGESFPIFLLPADRISGGGSLAERLQRTGRWHHQIVQGGQAQLFARSRIEPAGEGLEVQEVVSGKTAAALRAASRFIDATSEGRVADDTEAQLVLVPAFYVTAFLLVDTDREWIVIVERPSGMEGLRLETWHSAESFLSALAGQPAPFGLPAGLPDPA